MSELNESPQDRTLLDALAKLPSIEPPHDQRERFRVRASAHHVGSRTPRWMPWAIAATLLLAVGGAWWSDVRDRNAETIALRERLATALADLSVATRFQAIESVGGGEIRDEGIHAALVDALLHDSSPNVRTAAAEALGRVAETEAFIAAASQSIAKETSPFVHSALMRTVVLLEGRDRDLLLRALLARTDLDPVLRARATASLKS